MNTIEDAVLISISGRDMRPLKAIIATKYWKFIEDWFDYNYQAIIFEPKRHKELCQSLTHLIKEKCHGS
jgi:hypothetical protein